MKLKEVAVYHRLFGKYISQSKIIEYLLEQDSELRNAYDIFQDMFYVLKKLNYTYFASAITRNYKVSSGYIRTSLKTFKEFLPHIENSLKYKYSNGIIEGINNKIKTIKRIGVGYRSFLHFKTRILICCSLLPLKKILAA